MKIGNWHGIRKGGAYAKLRLPPPLPMPLCSNDPCNRGKSLSKGTRALSNVWRHGDYIVMHRNRTGGITLMGICNIFKTLLEPRIGTAEVYNVVEKIQGIPTASRHWAELGGRAAHYPLREACSRVPVDTRVEGAKLEKICGRVSSSCSGDHHGPDAPYTMKLVECCYQYHPRKTGSEQGCFQ